MPGIDILLMALIAIPILMAMLIIKLTDPTVSHNKHSVLPTYWGNYSNAQKSVHPSVGMVKLHCIRPENGPSIAPVTCP